MAQVTVIVFVCQKLKNFKGVFVFHKQILLKFVELLTVLGTKLELILDLVLSKINFNHGDQ